MEGKERVMKRKRGVKQDHKLRRKKILEGIDGSHEDVIAIDTNAITFGKKKKKNR